MLARHTTFDIQKLKKNLNGVEQRPYPTESAACITGSSWADSPCHGSRKKKSQWSGTLLFFFLRAWNNGIKADFYSSLLRVLRGALWPTSPCHGSLRKKSQWSGTLLFLLQVPQSTRAYGEVQSFVLR